MSENERRAAAYSRRCGRKRRQHRLACIQRAAAAMAVLVLLAGFARWA